MCFDPRNRYCATLSRHDSRRDGSGPFPCLHGISECPYFECIFLCFDVRDPSGGVAASSSSAGVPLKGEFVQVQSEDTSSEGHFTRWVGTSHMCGTHTCWDDRWPQKILGRVLELFACCGKNESGTSHCSWKKIMVGVRVIAREKLMSRTHGSYSSCFH